MDGCQKMLSLKRKYPQLLENLSLVDEQDFPMIYSALKPIELVNSVDFKESMEQGKVIIYF
jgi:hypothetical protein